MLESFGIGNVNVQSTINRIKNMELLLNSNLSDEKEFEFCGVKVLF